MQTAEALNIGQPSAYLDTTCAKFDCKRHCAVALEKTQSAECSAQNRKSFAVVLQQYIHRLKKLFMYICSKMCYSISRKVVFIAEGGVG